MKSLRTSLTITFAPFLGIGYYYLAKVLMSGTQVAKYLEGTNNSVINHHLAIYKFIMFIAPIFGCYCSFKLAKDIVEFISKNLQSKTLQAKD